MAKATDKDRARVWDLAEQGNTYRDIRAKLGVSYHFIRSTFAQDEQRILEIRSAAQEARAHVLGRLEDVAKHGLELYLNRLVKAVFDSKGRPKARMSQLDHDMLRYGPRMASVFARALQVTAREGNLARGAATDRVEQLHGLLDPDTPVDELIEMAVRLEAVDDLPPALRERYDAALESGRLEEPATNGAA